MTANGSGDHVYATLRVVNQMSGTHGESELLHGLLPRTLQKTTATAPYSYLLFTSHMLEQINMTS